jgi:hypothetical protein
MRADAIAWHARSDTTAGREQSSPAAETIAHTRGSRYPSYWPVAAVGLVAMADGRGSSSSSGTAAAARTISTIGPYSAGAPSSASATGVVRIYRARRSDRRRAIATARLLMVVSLFAGCLSAGIVR